MAVFRMNASIMDIIFIFLECGMFYRTYSNLCSAFNPSKVHTHSSEHTPWTHTRSSGQPFMLRSPGSSCGFGALLKGTCVMVLKVPPSIPPTYKFLLDQDSNSQPLDYKSNSLTITSRLPRGLLCKKINQPIMVKIHLLIFYNPNKS